MNFLTYLDGLKNIDNLVYIPNPGNAGDAVIMFATLQLFEKVNLKFELGSHKHKYINKTLLIGGGGNLIAKYKDLQNFIKNNYIDNRITVLPHTIYGVNQTLEYLKACDATVFVREPVSYNYAKSVVSNIHLDKDVVLYLDVSKINISSKTNVSDNLYCYRRDHERTNISIRPDNQDLSILMNDNRWVDNIEINNRIVSNLFNKLNEYRNVFTNRMHIAICSALLGKTVSLYPNNYFKNKAVFDYSLHDMFPNMKFYL